MCKIKAITHPIGCVIAYCFNFEKKVSDFVVEEFMKFEIPVITLDYTKCNLSNKNINVSIYRTVSMLNFLNKIQTVFVLLPDNFKPLFKGNFVVWNYIDDTKAKYLNISDLKRGDIF